jgi:DNA-binding LacI/PurR family transcriptional regulator
MTARRNRKFTLKDIAEYVGTAKSTVSRVLNNTSTKIPVTEKTRKKIFDAARKFDYSPDINARRLSNGKSHIIALVIPSLTTGALADHTIMSVMTGMEEAIINTRYKLLLLFRTSEFVSNKEYLKLFKENCIEGMIIWGATFEDNYVCELAGRPVIEINTYFPDSNISTITHDSFGGFFKLTEYLIKKGHRKFLHIGSFKTFSIARERTEGFMQALKKHGIEIRDDHVFETFSGHDSAFKLMDKVLSNGKYEYDAVVAFNDSVALDVYTAARKHGKKIPEDFALTGADGVDVFGEGVAPITTVRVDCRRMGKMAVEKLIAMIEGRQKYPFKEVIDTEVLIRDTT